jgi:colicin import membrane protein
MTTELIEKQTTQVAAYQPFYAQLSELEKNNKALVFNYEDKKGNKEARSHVNTLRLTKGALERTRKEAKAESLKLGRAVDAEAEQINTRIESMIKVHQDELDRIEEIEVKRIAEIKNRIGAISTVHFDVDAKNYRFHLSTLEAVVIDESWQEFIAEAAQAKDASIAKHRELLFARVKADYEAAELERLRKEASERAQKDRDDAIAAAAVEAANLKAQALADAIAVKAKQAIIDAETTATKEREAAAHRELSLKLEVESAERRRLESEQRAKDDALKAVEDEKRRVAQVAKSEADATAKREANKNHLAAINNAALTAFVDNGIAENVAKLVISLIAKGLIPAIAISY